MNKEEPERGLLERELGEIVGEPVVVELPVDWGRVKVPETEYTQLGSIGLELATAGGTFVAQRKLDFFEPPWKSPLEIGSYLRVATEYRRRGIGTRLWDLDGVLIRRLVNEHPDFWEDKRLIHVVLDTSVDGWVSKEAIRRGFEARGMDSREFRRVVMP